MTDVQAERNACADLVGSRAKSIKAEAERMRKTSQASYGDAIDAYSAMLSAAPEYEPEADEDGWIKWDGGDCPIGLDQMVDVMFRDKQEFHSESADEWRWDHDFGGGDIVAYRITK